MFNTSGLLDSLKLPSVLLVLLAYCIWDSLGKENSLCNKLQDPCPTSSVMDHLAFPALNESVELALELKEYML